MEKVRWEGMTGLLLEYDILIWSVEGLKGGGCHRLLSVLHRVDSTRDYCLLLCDEAEGDHSVLMVLHEEEEGVHEVVLEVIRVLSEEGRLERSYDQTRSVLSFSARCCLWLNRLARQVVYVL